MAANNVTILKNFELPKAPGAHYRLVCLNGPRKGDTYYFRGNRVVMGRSNKCDIVIHDAKSSREHAEVTRVGAGFVITDLKSQNGIIVNDEKVKQKELSDGDRVIIGQTVYKFGRIKVDENSPDIKVIDSKEDVEEDDETEEEDKKVGKKKMMMVLVGLALLYFMIDDGKQPIHGNLKDASHRLSNVSGEYAKAVKKKRNNRNEELADKLQAIFLRGLREVREKNFYRAINEFNLALILDPGNGRAQFYLDKAKQALDDEVENIFVTARKDVDALRYQSAIVSYCAIVRLLQTNPADKRYKAAVDNIKEMEKLLGMESGEVECLQKQ